MERLMTVGKRNLRIMIRPSKTLHQSLIDVAHLLRRAGFGANPAEILAAAEQGKQAIAHNLIAYDQIPETAPPPPASINDAKSRSPDDLAAWWLTRMISTQRPLQEKMTLFWHGHFATALSKVGQPSLMYAQNETLRANALGRFDDMLTAVYKDPAMLIWLDGQRNIKGAPNENWGREVMELFTLGRGNYTEDDVHASAGAFTGWRIGSDGQAVFVPRLHDDGPKTLLGQTGNWSSDDAVRILAAHPATGRFLATKLWMFFASDTPPKSAIEKLAQTYVDSNHSMRAVVTTLFTTPEFYSPSVRARHVKSPVEFIVTAVRELGLQNVQTAAFPRYLALLGQELFNPPNVGGWPGGTNWISAMTMLGRFNFASRLTGNAPGSISLVDGNALAQVSGADTTEGLMFFVTNVLGLHLSPATTAALMNYLGKGSLADLDADVKVRGLVHLALASPEYQLS
jgi:uncharacterized protein (DUF1800 family)